MVPPRKATSAAAAARAARQVALEVADDGVHLDAGVLGGDRGAGAARRVASLTSNGTNRRSRRRRAEGVEQEPGLRRTCPEPSSTSVSAPGDGGDGRRPRASRISRSRRVG